MVPWTITAIRSLHNTMKYPHLLLNNLPESNSHNLANFPMIFWFPGCYEMPPLFSYVTMLNSTKKKQVVNLCVEMTPNLIQACF